MSIVTTFLEKKVNKMKQELELKTLLLENLMNYIKQLESRLDESEQENIFLTKDVILLKSKLHKISG